MNRRQVIIVIFLTIVIALAVKWWRWAKPASLSVLKEKKRLIAELAEAIIPRTNTPGAKDAKVDDFILQMVTSGISSLEQRTFLHGLQGIDDYCLKHFQREFIMCAKKEREEVLTYFESEEAWSRSFRLVSKVRNKLLGRSFFSLIKYLTVVGYCTSEVGCTVGLAYDYIPMQYQSCVTLKQGQKTWATL